MIQLLIKNGAKIDLDLSNDIVKVQLVQTETGIEINKTILPQNQ